jgi:uncharacterized protein (DUF2267 family)
MGAFGLKSIDQTLHLTHLWLNELLERTGWSDKQRVYRLLRTTLQATRDHLPVNEAVDMGAQLPLLIRGIYYEGWHPAGVPVKTRSKDAFIDRIQGAFKTDPMDDPEAAVGAVFALLSERITKGEMADVRHTLPKQIRELFPS